ncbi:MAG: hypothetical protein R3336_05580, partial [Phycisphaeraceae bacterium]|nr:hypothetical protein [Phycisphaeraceae bacterium]
MDGAVLIVLFVVGIFALGIWSWIREKKRREALVALAKSLGLKCSTGKDYALADELSFLDKTRSGSDRYAYNVMRGTFEGEEILAFDYHYETHSTDSKGRRTTTHHYQSYVTLRLPKAFPELTIAPEGFFSKIAQAVGYDDIDFESAEFSREYVVRSEDRKFAYDFCHGPV